MQVLITRTVDALRADEGEEAYRLVKCQLNFMEDHLGAWAPLLTEQMRGFCKTKFYEGLSWMTDGFLEVDTALMEDMLSDDDGEDEDGAAGEAAAASQDGE